MEVIRKFKKSEKGSITIMVLTAMLFMLVVITISYLSISNESIGQNKKISQISGQYQVTDDDMEQEYEKVVNSLKVKDLVKVGDYVDYEPTKTDVSKTQAVEESKLKYISPVGGYDSTKGIITHGNGYTSEEEGGGQTFTAKSNDELKWRVLSVSDDRVELISEDIVLKDQTSQDSGKFVLEGGIGYLYAEQELNEICKIYGYGYGADTNIETEYTVGGPEDTPIIGKIKGSGARSLTIDDLNKIANIAESDYKTLNASYGMTMNPRTEIYYPALNSTDSANPGQSANTKAGLKNTYYYWLKEKVDSNIHSMLFKEEKYWLASRCITTYSDSASFYVRIVDSASTDTTDLCNGYSSSLVKRTRNFCAVRPVVTLKANVINLGIDYSKDNIWRLK